MRRLLLIAYYYPPIAGAGTFRPLRITRYLPQEGWSVSVLSVSEGVRLVQDPSLGSEVPEQTRVVRSPTIEPRTLQIGLGKIGLRSVGTWLESMMLLPDEQRGWVPFAVSAGRKLLDEQRHDAMLSTSSPYSTHLVARRLAAYSGLPWAADFRDEWTTNPYLTARYPTSWHLQHNRKLERRILTEADAVVSVSEPWLSNHRGLVPGEPEEKFVVVTNGYDPAHFAGRTWSPPEKFRLLYSGTFYGIRRADTFIEGVRQAIEKGLLPAEEFELVLMGHGNSEVGAGQLPPGVLRAIEHRPQSEAIDEMYRAAAFVLVVPRAGGPGNHTGKIFNYLAVGAPILTLAPEPNVAADLVRESGSGIVVAPDDPVAVAEAVGRLYRMWKGEEPAPVRRPEIVEAYAADRQATEWARLFDRLADAHARRKADTC